MEWGILAALIIGALITVFLIACVWTLCIGKICAAIMKREKAKTPEKALSGITCSVDLDCPPGYICLDGHCVPR